MDKIIGMGNALVDVLVRIDDDSLLEKLHLPEGSTTVGGHIESSHLKPTPLGAEVKAEATLTKVDGRKLYFTVKAMQGDAVIGEGTHLRFIVDREKFMSKL